MGVMHHEIQSYIIANARQLGFDNIIGFNAREKVLREAIKLKCSTARAQLRTNIIHTISGKKRYPLDRAAVFLAEKLKRGGVTNKLKVEYILRVALLRRFASDDAQEDTRRGKQQHEQDEEDTAGDDSDGERPTKRKKKNTFWDRRDAYIADKIKRNGNQMDNAGWKLFLSNLVQQDIEQWGPLDGHVRAEALPIPSPSSASPSSARHVSSARSLRYSVPPASDASVFSSALSTPSPLPQRPSAMFPVHEDYTSQTQHPSRSNIHSIMN